MNTAIVIILLIIDSIISTLITRKWCKGRFAGWLRIDRSNPDEEPYLFAEIKKGVGDISKMKYVTFEVKDESYLPPE